MLLKSHSTLVLEIGDACEVECSRIKIPRNDWPYPEMTAELAQGSFLKETMLNRGNTAK